MATVSSHTLNGLDGTHAGGIAVSLVCVDHQDLLFSTTMDANGRLAETINPEVIDPAARFELVFETLPYWHARNVNHQGVIAEIVLRFAMPDPEARYHMPLILSPNGYSTWASEPER